MDLENDVRALAGVDPIDTINGPIALESRYIGHPHHAYAKDWLESAFTDIPGLNVELEPVFFGGQELHNIIAERPGEVADAPVVIVAAHYDSIASLDPSGDWVGETDSAPGADDNASGVAAILAMAQALADPSLTYDRTVRFIAFTAEEEGLVGSFQHVEQLAERGEDVRMMFSLDPIGHNPSDTYWLWYSYDSRWPQEADHLDQTAVDTDSPLTLQGVDEALLGGDERSDHYPFWAAGYPAIHIGSFPPPTTYHTMQDTIDVVDFEYLEAVTQLATSHVHALAEPTERRGLCATSPPSSCLWLGISPLLLLISRRRVAF